MGHSAIHSGRADTHRRSILLIGSYFQVDGMSHRFTDVHVCFSIVIVMTP